MDYLISSRLGRSGDDPIFSLNAEATRRKRAGESIVNATIGALLDDEGQLAILPTVTELLKEVTPLVGAGYAPIAGSPDFLRAVIQDLLPPADRDMAIAVATPGGSGALRHAIANFLEPGQSLLTTNYYWGPYLTLADETDRKLSTFRMFDTAGRFDVADFDKALGQKLTEQGRALIFINSPCHNPTGYSLDDSEWRDLVNVVEANAGKGPTTLLLDVAYARYGAGSLENTVREVMRISDKAQVLFAWSASKSFTQYGLRVGALVAIHPEPEPRQRILNSLTYACRGTWSNCNAAGMAAITRALTESDVRDRVDTERAKLKALLDARVSRWNQIAKQTGLRHPRYDGGFFTTVFCEEAPAVAQRLKEAGMFVVPQKGALRVGLCSVAERDVEKLARAIASCSRA